MKCLSPKFRWFNHLCENGRANRNLLHQTTTTYCGTHAQKKTLSIGSFLSLKRRVPSSETFAWIELEDGKCRRLTRAEMRDDALVPRGQQVSCGRYLRARRDTSGSFAFDFEGKEMAPVKGRHWSTNLDGMRRLAAKIASWPSAET